MRHSSLLFYLTAARTGGKELRGPDLFGPIFYFVRLNGY